MATITQSKIDMARRALAYSKSAVETLNLVASDEPILINARERINLGIRLMEKFIADNTQPSPNPIYPAGKYPVA